MKSVFLSMLIFLVLFVFIKFGMLVIFGNAIFHYAAIILFVAVIACACYFVGIKDNPQQTEKSDGKQPEEDKTNEK